MNPIDASPKASTQTQPVQVDAFVDPTCPFAWITSQWLAEVGIQTRLRVNLRLMSLSVVNEGRNLEDWYRQYNDRAWRPARVAAALLASERRTRWPDFYRTFGHRRHVLRIRDDDPNLIATLKELDLPPALAAAADDPTWDGDLRERTQQAVGPLRTDGGTPLLHLDGIPRGPAAVKLWDAVRVLAATPNFAELKRGRAKELATA
jgi:hypothetical protein